MKRFTLESSAKRQRFLGENPASRLLALSDKPGARFQLTFGAGDSFREPLEIDAADFVAVKSFKAKGKRLTTFNLATVEELEPRELPAPETPEEEQDADAPEEAETGQEGFTEVSDDELRDQILGQERLF